VRILKWTHCVWASPIKPNFIVNKNLVSLRQVVAANSIIIVVTFIQIPKPRQGLKVLGFSFSIIIVATARLIPSFLSHSLLLLLHHPRFGKPEESTLVSPPPTSRNTKAECRPFTASPFSSTVTSTTSLAGAAARERSATIGLRLTDDSDRHDHHEHRFVCNLRSGSLFFRFVT